MQIKFQNFCKSLPIDITERAVTVGALLREPPNHHRAPDRAITRPRQPDHRTVKPFFGPCPQKEQRKVG